MEEKTCYICGARFLYIKNRITCGKEECKREHDRRRQREYRKNKPPAAIRTGTCIICGEQFTYLRGKKLTCSEECSKKRDLLNKKEYQARNRKKKRINLVEAEKEARKMGISYGQYMASQR